jgi:hypothetical protein
MVLRWSSQLIYFTNSNISIQTEAAHEKTQNITDNSLVTAMNYKQLNEVQQ